MRIAIDARLNAYRQGGISQYTRQLLTALPDTARDDEFVSLQHREHLRPLALAPNVVRRSVYTPPHHRFEQWTMPVELLLARPNVAHFPDFVAPLRRPCPAVVTIHDLAFMHYPEILDDAARAYYSQVRTNAPRAEGIIAVSEATRQDIAQFIDIPIEQIDVIYEAAAPLYKPIPLRPGEARVLNSTPVEAGSFLLFVSTLEPRKNLPTLLQALRICLDRRPDAGYRLVIVGRRGWRDEPIFAAVRDLKLADHVLFAGGVGQYDLRWLYNACRIYINPSLYEGFGLPLLEAMACGAPCLAAATSSLPEIGGNAAIYVPPLDADVWADEIEALWDDDARRAELGRMGMARAQQFSWSRAARETMAVYRRAATERALPTTATPVQAGLDLPILTRAPMSPAGPRACVQCGADLKPTSLQHRLAMRADAAPASAEPIAPRAWACARCGHVELVVDWAGAEDGTGVLQYAPLDEGQPTTADAAELEASPAEADGGVATTGDRQPTTADAAELEEVAAEAKEVPAELEEVAAEVYDATAEADGGVATTDPSTSSGQADGQPTTADAAELEEVAAEAKEVPAELESSPAEAYDATAEANGALPESEILPATTPALPPDNPRDGQPALALPEDGPLDGGAAHSNGKHASPVASVKSNARSTRRSSGDTATTTTTKRRQNKTKRK